MKAIWLIIIVTLFATIVAQSQIQAVHYTARGSNPDYHSTLERTNVNQPENGVDYFNLAYEPMGVNQKRWPKSLDMLSLQFLSPGYKNETTYKSKFKFNVGAFILFGLLSSGSQPTLRYTSPAYRP